MATKTRDGPGAEVRDAFAHTSLVDHPDRLTIHPSLTPEAQHGLSSLGRPSGRPRRPTGLPSAAWAGRSNGRARPVVLCRCGSVGPKGVDLRAGLKGVLRF